MKAPLVTTPRQSIDISDDVIKEINYSSYRSWAQCFLDNKEIETFVLAAGDYSSWGIIEINSSTSGVKKRKIISTSVLNSDDHVISASRNVEVKGFDFDNAQNWELNGIVVDGGITNYIKNQSSNISFLNSVIRDVPKGNALRIVSSNNTIIRNCVFTLDAKLAKEECIAITVSARQNKESRNTLIENNEIVNYTDGVQLYYKTKTSSRYPIPMNGSVPGTIIRNNDIYITPDLYSQSQGAEVACAENGIDIKVGTESKRESDIIGISNNRLWGFRRTTKGCADGSHGSAIVVHKNAKHIFIDNNFIYDSARGISVLGSKDGNAHGGTEEIVIVNNFISDMYGKGRDNGYGLIVRNPNTYVLWNTINKAPGLISLADPPVIKYNVFMNIGKSASTSRGTPRWFQENAWNKIGGKSSTQLYGNCLTDGLRSASIKDYEIELRRITNPYKKVVKKSYVQGLLKLDAKCKCELKEYENLWWFDTVNNLIRS
tara:strand:- start:5334 stop:6797 length:1464 start_codon:yes stop_codon:yes gene_type:complete